MERKKINILRVLAIFIAFLFVPICNAQVLAKQKTKEIIATLRVIEEPSRVELSSEKIKLVENQLVNQTLKMGNELKKHTVSIGMRKVNIDGIAGYIWIEVRLKDPAENQIAYLVTTVPSEKFSVGTGFILNKSRSPLVLMIDNL